MDLRSDEPYWLLRHGIVNSYPSLTTKLSTDFLVMGAGISGALLAIHLAGEGHRVAVVDRRHVGGGSTAASTSLLQYEIDTPLYKLADKIGEEKAIKSYLLCLQAIGEIGDMCEKLRLGALFTKRPSLQYASSARDWEQLKKEEQLRKKAGISVSLVDGSFIKSKFGFVKSGGLFSQAAAETDAYRLTHGILQACMKKKVKVFDNSSIVAINHDKKRVRLLTSDGMEIITRKLFIAAGYEAQRYIPFSIQQLAATYAIVSEPMPDEELWYRKTLIWETARPYLYMRTTSDNRIMVGGKDIAFTSARKRDDALRSKAMLLKRSFARLFPQIRFKTDFRWTGVFGNTKDGLPFIGSIRQRPNTYFALGFGGNGITFSQIAARMLADLVHGKKNPDQDIFSFDRLK